MTHSDYLAENAEAVSVPNAAPVVPAEVTSTRLGAGEPPQVAAPLEELANQRMAREAVFLKAFQEAQGYKGDTDPLEMAIMKMALDYEGALSIVRTLEFALWKRYEPDIDIAHAFSKLLLALGEAEEPEPDPKWDEDQIADDPHRL